MYLQEHIFFDLDLRVNVAQNIAKYPLHHVTYAPAKFEVAMSNVLGGYAFSLILQENTLYDRDLGVNVTRNIAQYPLHHFTYAPAKFEVAMSNV